MRRGLVGLVILALASAACGGTTAEVVIDTRVLDIENGTFTATGEMFECSGRFGTLDYRLNAGDSWFFDGDYVCDDGSGTLFIRIEGEGPEPDPGEAVGTWTVTSGSGDYEGFTGEGIYDLSITPWTERLVGELTSG